MDLKSEGGGDAEPTRRRRGAALEDALLTAAWEELQENGYGGLTFEAVAARAHTSRPVVHRRWRSRQELAHAAVVHRGRNERTQTPDTGSLRGDMLALLGRASQRKAETMALLTFRFGAYFEETGSSFAELRAAYLGDRMSSVEAVLDRAAARGEIDRDAVTPRIAALPGDLVRHEMIMTLQPVPEEVLEEIVDTMFLPLVTGRPAQR